MGREVRLDRGEGTWVKKGEAPRAPIALLLPPSPGDLKALYQVLPSQFKLIPVDNAVSYRVMLSTDPVFKNIVRMAIHPSPDLSNRKIPVLGNRCIYFLGNDCVDHHFLNFHNGGSRSQL